MPSLYKAYSLDIQHNSMVRLTGCSVTGYMQTWPMNGKTVRVSCLTSRDVENVALLAVGVVCKFNDRPLIYFMGWQCSIPDCRYISSL